jgi:hypothetical protein
MEANLKFKATFWLLVRRRTALKFLCLARQHTRISVEMEFYAYMGRLGGRAIRRALIVRLAWLASAGLLQARAAGAVTTASCLRCSPFSTFCAGSDQPT